MHFYVTQCHFDHAAKTKIVTAHLDAKHFIEEEIPYFNVSTSPVAATSFWLNRRSGATAAAVARQRGSKCVLAQGALSL
jgi:hypothetical protein